MPSFELLNLLLIGSILGSDDVYFDNGWIGVANPHVVSQIRSSHIETRHAYAWKPSQDFDYNSANYINENAIQIITPEQAETTRYEKNVSTIETATEVTKILAINKVLEDKDSSYFNSKEDKNISTDRSKDEMHNKYFTADEPQRPSKQSRSLSFTKDIVSTTFQKPTPNPEKAETNILITVKNITGNTYEVTEPSNNQELRQDTNDLNRGYIYQQSPFLISNLTVTRNEYLNKFVNFLSKYNIKAQDMLDNYARSKLHKKSVSNFYPMHVPTSTLTYVPFRYNSLNHRPVDPLLAVLLSNYGFYLPGFYGLPNNYKNLYAYSASNNIHNNKPFDSYKIYSDTDSVN